MHLQTDRIRIAAKDYITTAIYQATNWHRINRADYHLCEPSRAGHLIYCRLNVAANELAEGIDFFLAWHNLLHLVSL